MVSKYKHQIIEGVEYKVCTGCLKLKTLDKFYIRTQTNDGFNTTCKECDKKRQKYNAWYKLRWEILLRDRFTCKYCGKTVKDGIKLQVDHIIPKLKGGRNTKDNLITSCNICNVGKSDVLLAQHDLKKVHKLMLENNNEE